MKLATVALITGVLMTTSPPMQADPLVNEVSIGTYLHPLEEPESIPWPGCYKKGPCRFRPEHVYVFGVNGANPLYLGNFNGLLGYFQKYGFNTYVGQLYTSHGFTDKIIETRKADPEARIAVIGFSAGAIYARGIVNALNQDCVPVDLCVYLAGDYITNCPTSFPPNVKRLVNVRARGLVLSGGDLFFNGEDIDGAANHHLTCRHILTPSRRETIEMMMQELLILGCFPEPSPARTMPPSVP